MRFAKITWPNEELFVFPSTLVHMSHLRISEIIEKVHGALLGLDEENYVDDFAGGNDGIDPHMEKEHIEYMYECARFYKKYFLFFTYKMTFLTLNTVPT